LEKDQKLDLINTMKEGMLADYRGKLNRIRATLKKRERIGTLSRDGGTGRRGSGD